MSRCASLSLGLVLFSGCMMGTPPKPTPLQLTGATASAVRTAVGSYVEVQGVVQKNKAVSAEHFSAFVDLAMGQRYPRSGTQIRVIGLLQEADPALGASFRIVDAICWEAPQSGTSSDDSAMSKVSSE
ncbi:MAG: hypothetical protein SH850_08200 [Planctomycetaceae bacterium]|nr:hypothetical protein [Planctomycetaceae bacterium]